MRKVINVDDGTVVQELEYDAGGVVTGDTNPGWQPFGYAGGLYEAATGLVRFGARDYDAQVGRWTSKEPIGFQGSLSFFAYCDNDPLKMVDPTGLKPYELYESLEEAAKDFGAEFHGRDNEWATHIVKIDNPWPLDDYWYYREPWEGRNDAVSWAAPDGSLDYDGHCHTHAKAEPGYDNNSWSDADKRLCTEYGGPCFMFTPNGHCGTYVPGEGLGSCE